MPDYPRVVDGLTRSEMEDGLSVSHPGSTRVHFLNHTGALILELCTGDHDVAAIVGLIQATFLLREPPEIEVRQLLQQAIDAGLVVWTAGPERSPAR
jgi:hypothetical protein